MGIAGASQTTDSGPYPKFVAAAVQAAPLLPMNKRATLEKVCTLIEEAASNGARLIVFPETFVPMYPNWSIDLSRPAEWALLLRELTEQAVDLSGDDLATVSRAARTARAYVCLGINEKVPPYDGLLYNTLVLLGPDGSIIGRHRKLLPSNREKVFWHRGDATDLSAVWPTEIGRVGGLICYEHLQPLFKYALMAQGEQVHCAAWPGWPDYPSWRSNRQVIDVASRAYALEGQCFVVIASLYVSPEQGQRAGFGNASWTFFGGSGIVNPAGEYLAGPVYEQESIAYAEVDLGLIPLRKAAIDTTGRDSRFDLVRLWLTQEGEQQPWVTGQGSSGNPPTSLEERMAALERRLEALEKSSPPAEQPGGS